VRQLQDIVAVVERAEDIGPSCRHQANITHAGERRRKNDPPLAPSITMALAQPAFSICETASKAFVCHHTDMDTRRMDPRATMPPRVAVTRRGLPLRLHSPCCSHQTLGARTTCRRRRATPKRHRGSRPAHSVTTARHGAGHPAALAHAQRARARLASIEDATLYQLQVLVIVSVGLRATSAQLQRRTEVRRPNSSRQRAGRDGSSRT
jgi:hypothetical protein